VQSLALGAIFKALRRFYRTKSHHIFQLSSISQWSQARKNGLAFGAIEW
jgi:hypothetical protein